MIRRLACFCCLAFSADTVHATTCFQTSCLELVALAERAVVATIVRVREDSVDVRIDDVVFGPGSAGETISLARTYEAGICGRWAAYALGQQSLLFLKVDELDRRRFAVFRAEGESQVLGDGVSPQFMVRSREVVWMGADRRLLPLIQVKEALADCRKQFQFSIASKERWISSPEGRELVPFERIDVVSREAAVRSFRKRYPPGMTGPEIAFYDRSPFHRFLAAEIAAEQQKIQVADLQQISSAAK